MIAFTHLEKLGDVPGVVAQNALLTAHIKTKKNLHAIYLRCTAAGSEVTDAQLIADFTAVRLMQGSKPKWDAPAAFLKKRWDALYNQDGVTYLGGVLPITLTRPDHPTAAQRNALAWGMADIDSLTLQLQCNPAAAPTTARIEIWVEVDDLPARALGSHITLRPFEFNIAGTGYTEISTLPTAEGAKGVGRLNLWIDASAATTNGLIGSVIDKVDSLAVYDDIPTSINQFRCRRSGKYQRYAANYIYIVDYASENDILGFLPMDNVKSYLQKVNFPATIPNPAKIKVYVEQIEGIFDSDVPVSK